MTKNEVAYIIGAVAAMTIVGVITKKQKEKEEETRKAIEKTNEMIKEMVNEWNNDLMSKHKFSEES